MNITKILLSAALVAPVLPAMAAVSAEEAAKLKGELTPYGAEKAGNKDGSIPPWTGGYTTLIPGDKPGGRRGDPFANEKPLFSITSKNAEQYADKLTDGVKAMLNKYPEYRIDVYPTHRTAVAPKWVYDNIFKNATTAKLVNDIPENFYGGVPFPIPKTGAEVIWNHMLRWRGTSYGTNVTQYQITTDGRAVMTVDGVQDIQSPIYMPDGSWEAFDKSGSLFYQIRFVNIGPAIRAGEAIVGGQALDGNKSPAWVYLTGQRRVRKLPNPCCDTPTPYTAGMMSFDELEVWTGRIDRFDWKLLGKKEMYIPYNNNRILQPKTDAEVIGPHYVKPEYNRFELHRVWVVEATLRPGQRHQAVRNRYYCNEDNWQCVLADRWDANGQLWRTVWGMNFVAPDLPGTVSSHFGYNELLSGNAFIANLYTGKQAHYPLKPRFPDSNFTPEALAGESVR
jgi:hypothetical protein